MVESGIEFEGGAFRVWARLFGVRMVLATCPDYMTARVALANILAEGA